MHFDPWVKVTATRCWDFSMGTIDLLQSGQKVHKLTFVGEIKKVGNRTHIKVQCDCGVVKFVEYQNWRIGKTKTCGCEMYPTDNHTKDPLYPIWHDIRCRCKNANHPQFDRYGGDGVRICEEWDNSFYAFRDWCVANGWKKGLQVDKDAKGGKIYSPDNCSILTPAKNTQLRKVVKLTPEDIIEIRSDKGSAAKIAKKYGVCRGHIRNIRIGKKWKEL